MSVQRLKMPVTVDHAFKARGHRWRVQSDEAGRFDEIVVVVGKETAPRSTGANGLVLHAEMMNRRECFIDIAGVCFWVSVDKDGVARITGVDDRRPIDGKNAFLFECDPGPSVSGAKPRAGSRRTPPRSRAAR